MARRINTKFVIFLCVILVSVGVVLGATLFVATRMSAHAALRAAEEAMAAGEYLEATELYPKVIRYRKYGNDVDMMLMLCDAYRKVPCATRKEAGRHLAYEKMWLGRATLTDPGDGRAFARLMDMHMELARNARYSVWDEMFNDTQELLSKYPDVTAARKYRGISQVNRLAAGYTNLTDEQRNQALEDLQEALQREPDDHDVIEHLSLQYMLEAREMSRAGGSPQRAQDLRDRAAQLTGDAVERHPQDSRRLIEHLHNLSQIASSLREPDRSAMDSRIRPQLDGMIDKLTAEPVTPYLTHKAATLLQINHQSDSGQIELPVVRRASELLEATLQKHPDSTMLQVVLGQLYRRQNRMAEATQIYKEAWMSPLNIGSLPFLIRHGPMLEAGLFYLQLELQQVRALQDVGERETQLAQIETQLNDIKSEIGGENSVVAELEAKISSARGQWALATQQFDRVGDAVSDLMTLWEAARALAATGEWGAAAAKYELILRLRPKLEPVRKALVRMYLNGQLLEKATDHIESLQSGDEEDEDVRRLQLELFVRQERFEEADRLLEELVIDHRITDTVRLARLYRRADRNAKAIELLEKAFAKTPDNLVLLNWLVQFAPEKASRMAYVDRSRTAGVKEELLGRVEQFIEGNLDVRAELDARQMQGIEDAADPVTQALLRYRFHVSRQEPAEAQAALDGVVDQAPGHPDLINALFDNAMTRMDWDRATQIAELARDALDGKGLDLAGGAFYQGRLNMAQGKTDQAIIDFRAGLEQRRTYSTGWRLLGEALRRVQEFTAAIDAYSTGLKLRPDSITALLGLAAAQASRGEQETALEIVRRAHRYRPDNYRVTHAYLQYELRHGDAQLALSLRRRLASDFPQNTDNRRALAMALAEKQLHDEAKQVMDELIAEEGQTLSNTITVTNILSQTGHIDEAIELLRQYVRSRGQEANIEDYLAVARNLLNIKQYDLAVSAYRQAITVEDPNLRPATRELAALMLSQPQGLAEAVELYGQLWDSGASDLQLVGNYVKALLVTGDVDKAESLLKQIVMAQGHTAHTLVLSAEIAAARGEFQRAEADLDHAIQKAPLRARLLLAKARLISMDTTRLAEALTTLDRAQELNPLLVDAPMMKARLYMVQGETSAAIREYEALLERAPRLFEARRDLAELYGVTGRFTQLEALAGSSAELFPESALWPRLQSQLARRDKNMDEAISKLELAVQLEPREINLADLVALQLQNDRASDALAIMRTHVDMVTSDPLLQAIRGRAVLQTQNRQEAMAVFAQALKLTKSLRQLLEVNKQIILALGDAHAVVALIDQTFEEPPLWVQMGLANLESNLAEHERAVQRLGDIERYVVDRPASEKQFFYRTYALSLHLSEQYERASEAYEKLIELQPRNATAMNNLAYLLVENLGRAEDAVIWAERALALAPNDANILDTLGWAQFKSGELTRANDTLHSSVRRQELPQNCLHMAEVMLAQEDRVSAREMLERARSLAEEARNSKLLGQINDRLKQLGL